MLKAVAGAAGIKHFWNKQLASIFPTTKVWSLGGKNEEQIWTDREAVGKEIQVLG